MATLCVADETGEMLGVDGPTLGESCVADDVTEGHRTGAFLFIDSAFFRVGCFPETSGDALLAFAVALRVAEVGFFDAGFELIVDSFLE